MMKDQESNQETAKEVVLLMSKDFRISRNIRLKWYFDHLNTLIASPNNAGDSSNVWEDSGLQIKSIIGSDNASPQQPLYIDTNTKLTFISSGYRFVFGLDLSASLLRVDTFQHLVMIEAILSNLEICLLSLMQNYTLPDKTTISPEVYVTIFAQWHGTKFQDECRPGLQRVLQKVIIQGCLLTKDMVSQILLKVKDSIYKTIRVDEPGRLKSALQKRDDILIGILRTGLLALRLLPSNTSSGVVIITDGVLGEPNPMSLERLLRQCQNTTASCSFVHVNPSAFPLCDFGCISNIELMQFIAQSTKGKYINLLNASNCDNENIYQQALFPWSFHFENQSKNHSSSSTTLNQMQNKFENCCSAFELRNISASPMDLPTLLSRKQDERSLRADLLTVVSARLREGYAIKYTKIANCVIEVCLVLTWWKNLTIVEYRVFSAWPLSPNKANCKVEVYISGTYEFLLDVSKRQESNQWTKPRKLVLHRFLRFFQDLMQSDHMLQYLRSFSQDLAKYTISDSLRQGQTLYYLPPNSSQFELSAQTRHTSSSFASYWKPILSLDVNIWQQWLHIHRIEIILHHDLPLPEHLHKVADSGRYHSVQCRVAFSQLISMLREWCTFVLLENHTYVKFIYDEESNGDKPCSFFLVRLSSKTPAMVLKLAFLIGLSGRIRKYYANDLRDRVASLIIPGATSTKRVRHSSSRISPNVKFNRTLHSATDTPCAILMHKPVDQVLVRYTETPENYLAGFNVTDSSTKSNSDVNEHYIRMRDMQWYLQHQRCVWSLTNGMDTPLHLDVACQLASLLLKLRKYEGYHIAYTSSGVVNLTREFPMRSCANSVSKAPGNINDFCLVQFIIFPPTKSCANISQCPGDSEDEDQVPDEVEQKEINFAVEVWVEPQHGCIRQKLNHSNPTHSPDSNSVSSPHFQQDIFKEVPYYEGLASKDIARSIIEHDSVCISNIVTLEHLQLMCSPDGVICSDSFPQMSESAHITTPSTSSHESSSPGSNPILSDDNLASHNHWIGSDENADSNANGVHHIPCVFNFAALLDQSPRVKHLFMTLAEDSSSQHSSNALLLTSFHKLLKSRSDCVVSLSFNDQNSITEHMLQRKNSRRKSSRNTDSFLQKPDNCSSGQWSCYLKKVDKGEVLVILLPATYDDFLNLIDIVSDESDTENVSVSSPKVFDYELTKETNQNVENIFSTKSPLDDKSGVSSNKIQRRISIKRLTSSNSNISDDATSLKNGVNISKKTFSVFIYNCSMQMLVSSLIQSVRCSKRIKWPDSYLDHRLQAEDINEDYIQSHELFSPKEPTSYSKTDVFEETTTNDDILPLVSPENDHVQKFSSILVELYHRSFVVGIASAVQAHTNPYFSSDDLQIATDYFCQESVDEIDITEFILLNSPQVVEFKSQNFHPNFTTDIKSFNDDDFQSDDPDIEDICQDSSFDPSFNSRNFSVHLAKKTSTSTTDSSSSPTALNLNRIDSIPSSSVKTEDNNVIPLEDNLAADSSSILTSETHLLDSSMATLNPNNTQAPTSVSLTLQNRKSAFTTVQRHFRSRSEEENMNSVSSTSEEDIDAETHKKSMQKVKRERKHTTTLPVKQVKAINRNSACMQAGWDNLPDFPLENLNVSHSRHLSGSNEQVERRFNALLKKYCAAVASVPYLYYAIKPNVVTSQNTTQQNPQHVDSDIEDVQFVQENELHMRKRERSGDSSNVYSVSSEPTVQLNLPGFEDNDSELSENDENIIPLFLYMTCSVRDKKTGNHGTFPVTCLPVSLKQVTDSFEQSCDSIDLSQIKITLDLIWIFVPSVNEKNMFNIPSDCLPCVDGARDGIKGLLEDEIISSLRTTESISATVLDRAAKHVQASKSSHCFMCSVPLQFIFGVDKSKPLFCDEFERLRMENYKIKKEGNFYYLSLERAFMPIQDFVSFKDGDTTTKQVFDLSSQDKNLNGNAVLGTTDADQSFSPRSDKPKLEIGSTTSKQGITSKTAAVLKHDRSSCISLYAIEPNGKDSSKREKRLKKASSSIELSHTSFSACRSTSISCLPCSESTSENQLCSTSLWSNRISGSSKIQSPMSQHQSLRASMSCGKESSMTSPLTVIRGNTKSMPGTPLVAANAMSENSFVFPPGLTKFDGRQNTGLSRDILLSPSSEYSPRQYSQVSWIESGYEGEESDFEEETDYIELHLAAFSQLPNFWLIVEVKDDYAKVFFQRRSSARVLKAIKVEHRRIFSHVCDNIVNACRAVNQTLLLKKLHDSRFCHSLLVEESPENIWKKEEYSNIYSQTIVDDRNIDGFGKPNADEYLVANMNFAPGHFECQCVLSQCIELHHRITSTSSSGSSSVNVAPALTTVKSFMKNFCVINQKNMFVFQVQDGTVYYCQMHEESKRLDTSGRQSSLLCSDSDVSTQSSTLREPKEHSRLYESNRRLCLCWYGVHPLTHENCDELEKLKEGIERKLNDTVLECITLMLSRNSQFKLTPADVSLIQPRKVMPEKEVQPKSPDSTISFSLPCEITTEKDVPSLLYYLHQNLLQFLVIPRYTEPFNAHFLPYCVDKKPITPKTMVRGSSLIPSGLYLYNGLTERGRKGHGIMCISSEFSYEKDSSLLKALPFDYEVMKVMFQKLLDVCASNDSKSSSSCISKQAVIHFHLWQRGSLKTDDLYAKLERAVVHAVCDTIMEKILQVPLFPKKLVKTEAMKTLFDSNEKEDTPFLQNFFQSKFGTATKAQLKSTTDDDSLLLPGDALISLYEDLTFWFENMKGFSCPSVTCTVVDFQSYLSLDQGIFNASKILSVALQDSQVLLFSRQQNSNWYYTTNIDLEPSLPGQHRQWLVLSHNYKVWKKIIGKSPSNFKLNSSSTSIQKFYPYDISIKPDASPCPQHELVSSTSYISRQHFVYLITQQKSVKIYLYNIAIDKCNAIFQEIKKCAKFHNARHSMLQGITFQKLGLFKHFLPKQQDSTKNLALGSYSVDYLTRHTRLPPQEKRKIRFTTADQQFDTVFVDVPKTKLLNTDLVSKDKVVQSGQQCFTILKHKQVLKEAQTQLKTLWRRPAANSFFISCSGLNIVLSHARLVYSLSSPVLFDSTTRRDNVALFIKNKLSNLKDNKVEISKQHTVLSRTSSFLGSYRRKSGDALNKIPGKEFPDLFCKESNADICNNCFQYMAETFAKLCAQHWRGFVKIEVNTTQSGQSGTERFMSDSAACYLYRAVPGGIILLSYTFLENRCNVQLYCINLSLSYDQLGTSLQKTNSNLFDCERAIKNMNVHLFSLQSHLRFIYWYLSDDHYFCRSTCSLLDLLQSLIECYEDVVDDFHCYLYRNEIVLACNPVKSNDLYNFIIENASIFSLKTCMVCKPTGNECIFYFMDSSKDHATGCPVNSHINHDICVIINKSEQSEVHVLKLIYHILFLRQPTFPETSRFKFSAAFNSRLNEKIFATSHQNTADSAPILQSFVSSTDSDTESQKSFGECAENTGYLGCEKMHVEKRLRHIATLAKTECFRHHYLWNRLALTCNDKGSGKTITLTELHQLLDLMLVTSASQFDPKICKLLQKQNCVSQGLTVQKRLLKNYPKFSTVITSTDKSVNHLCILSQQNIHVMVMISVDIGNQTCNVSVVEPLPDYKIFHENDYTVVAKELLMEVCDGMCISTWLSWL